MKFCDLDDIRKAFFRAGTFWGFFLLCFFLSFQLSGCGGSGGGDSTSSDVMGLTGAQLKEITPLLTITLTGKKVAPSESLSITVKVLNNKGLPAEGSTVYFSSLLGGTFDPSSGDTKAGFFTTKYTAPVNTGTDAITASSLGASGTELILITSKPQIPTQVDLVLGNPTLKPKTQTTVSVHVTQNGLPVEVNVALSSTIGGDFANNNGTSQKGWFTTTYTAPDLIASGTISAVALDGASSQPISTTNDFSPSPDVKLTLATKTLPPNGTTSLTVQAQVNGKPVIGSVILTSTAGTLGNSGTGTLTNGFYTTTYTAPSNAIGLATITATVEGASSSAQVFIINPSAEDVNFKLSLGSPSLYTGQTSAIRVSLFDNFGSPLDGAIVFDSSLVGNFNPPEGKLDSGIFYSVFTAGKETGTCTIYAFWKNLVATGQLLIATQTTRISIFPSQTVVQINTSDLSVQKVPISILVADQSGSPFSNEKVTVSTTAPCRMEPTDITTDANGYCTTSFIASSTAFPGGVLIQAFSREASASTQIYVVQ
ncbi:MAG: hypothetical protein HQM08_04990 [Candidatus Riflebacteria bacterium]|nr:hypothetical protein [Candidatus Riflebacteria bacterium]